MKLTVYIYNLFLAKAVYTNSNACEWKETIIWTLVPSHSSLIKTWYIGLRFDLKKEKIE